MKRIDGRHGRSRHARYLSPGSESGQGAAGDSGKRNRKVHQGSRATVSIPSLDGRKFKGKVETVGVAADPASRTYAVKVAVPNPIGCCARAWSVKQNLFPAMVNVMTVPGNAILRDPQGVNAGICLFAVGAACLCPAG